MMSSSHLERVVAAALSSSSRAEQDFSSDPFPPTELQAAVASAVNNGESLAVVAAMADLPSLAVLDALDALQPSSV